MGAPIDCALPSARALPPLLTRAPAQTAEDNLLDWILGDQPGGSAGCSSYAHSDAELENDYVTETLDAPYGNHSWLFGCFGFTAYRTLTIVPLNPTAMPSVSPVPTATNSPSVYPTISLRPTPRPTEAAFPISISGSCLTEMNDVFESKKITSNGKWYYKGDAHGYFFYYDDDCSGAGTHTSKWIISPQRPSMTATENLIGTTSCDGIVAYVESSSATPPTEGWMVDCPDRRRLDEAEIDHRRRLAFVSVNLTVVHLVPSPMPTTAYPTSPPTSSPTPAPTQSPTPLPTPAPTPLTVFHVVPEHLAVSVIKPLVTSTQMFLVNLNDAAQYYSISITNTSLPGASDIVTVTPASGRLTPGQAKEVMLSIGSTDVRPDTYHLLLNVEARMNNSLLVAKPLAVTLTTTSAAFASTSLVQLDGLPTIGENWAGIAVVPHDADGYVTLDETADFEVRLGTEVTNSDGSTTEKLASCKIAWAGTQFAAECLISKGEEVAGAWQLTVLLGDDTVLVQDVIVQCGERTYQRPDGKCWRCPTGTACEKGGLTGITLGSLQTTRGYWRADARSTEVYSCKLDGACESLSGGTVGDELCQEGYRGATCGSCEFPTHYLRVAKATCEECDNGAKAFVWSMAAVIAVLFVGAGGASSFYADRRMVKVRATKTYQMVSMSRLKILWILFQIISSVEHTLDLSFPQPFAKIVQWLSFLQLDIMHLPVGCIARFDFYQKLIFSTIAPMVVIAVVALTFLVRVQFVSDEEAKQKVFAVHVKLALFVSFMTYPTTSATVFEMLRPCDDFQYSPSFLAADRQLECGTSKYDAFIVYAFFMVLLIVIGVPLVYATLLYRNRSRVDPPCKDETMKQRVRAQDAEVAHITFLFKDYRSGCMYMEPIELLRRMLMIGLVGFCGERSETQSAVGTLISLLSVFLYREMHPFNDRLTNMLASIAMWMCFIVFLCSFIIVTRPFGYSDNALGGVLVGFFLVVIGASGYIAVVDHAEQAEVLQRQSELEFRECEADMDIAELRADILQLREKFQPHELEKERVASQVEDMAAAIAQARRQESTMIASNNTKQHTISFYNVQYPCYVLSLKELRKYERLPVHEDALRSEILDILTQTSTMPASAFAYFISQNWETFGASPHPDNVRNTKLNWLKSLPQHMKLPSTVSEVWVWWDLVSIPQRAREEQKKAIDSLCCYAQLCSRFVALVRDAEAWEKLYGESIKHPDFPTAGALSTYAARGWCRLELLCSLAPKKFKLGGWRPGPRNVRFRYHHNPQDAGTGPLITPALLRNPMDGNFTVDSDRDSILPVLEILAQRFAEYAASGSDAWDATIDVHKRPRWLKELAGVADDSAESPAVNPLLVGATKLRRVYRPTLVMSPLVSGDSFAPVGAINSRTVDESPKVAGGITKVHPTDFQSASKYEAEGNAVTAFGIDESKVETLPLESVTTMVIPPPMTSAPDVVVVENVRGSFDT